jgi:CHRD domain/Secretion system C-terminal sorting domain
MYIKTTLTNAQIADMMEDSVYFNVHTATNAGGEIRGQMILQTDNLFAVIATGAKEIPATTSPATAIGSLVVSATAYKVDYKIVANGLTGPITSAHLHFGAANRSGGVAFPLTFVGNVLSGSITTNQAFEDSLTLGNIYVNIHTTANAGGEIRGQMFYTGDGIGFDALIDGNQQVPAVQTNAKGAMYAVVRSTLDTLDYAVQTTGISPFISHLHIGTVGNNGGVAGELRPASAAFPGAFSGSIAMTPTLLADLLKDGIYANFHTNANQNGEIRGQVSSVLRTGLVANLCGGQEVPSVTTNASGAGYMSLARDKADVFVDVVTNGLSTNASGAHVHRGAKGVAGPVSINLTGVLVGNSARGTLNLAALQPLADSIERGLTYFNFHNTANPGGEIRGQAATDLVQECLANGTFELNGQKLSVKIAPNPVSERLNVLFESNEQFDAQFVILDIAGREITSKNVFILRGPNTVEVSMSNVDNGIYFVQMRQGNRLLFTEKVVKN